MTAARPTIRVTFVATVSVLLIATCVDVAQAVRAPTPRERGALQQAVFDYLRTDTRAVHPVIIGMRISTRAAPRPRGKATGYYGAFARVDIDDNRASGLGYLILGHFVAPLSGWRVLDLGSAAVGCGISPKIFRGHKAAVFRDLKLACP